MRAYKCARLIEVLIAVLFFAQCLYSQSNSCTYGRIWDQSGSAGYDPSTPGAGDDTWLSGLTKAPGPYTCTYTWISQYPPGHWYGSCEVWAYTCSQGAKPPAPAGSPPETGLGPGCPRCGQPINLTNGNTYIEETDVRVPGLGGGLTLQRTWNSRWPASQAASSSGMFGLYWRSTYEERLFMGNDATEKYSRADGSFWSFQLLNGDTPVLQAVAPAEATATLTDNGSSWTLAFKNGERRIFDKASGSLTSIIDRNGNTTQLSYDGLNRLTTVTDPAASHLNFTYANESSYLVTGVSSDVGLSVSYSYDAQGRLTQVTNPDQSTVNFAYDANSFITAVTDSQGKILESHTYDAQGRGLTSSRANGVEAVGVSYPQ